MVEIKEPELMAETLCFKGKTLDKQGKDKKGEDYKKWKLSFESGGKYDWKCNSFDKLSTKGVQVSDLVEGQFYEIVYKINSFVGVNGLTKSKQAVLIKVSSAEKSTAFNAHNKPTTGKIVITDTQKANRAAKDWVNFAKEYNEQMKDNPTKSAIHMLGAYVANKDREEFADIITLCKNNFK